VSAKTDAHKALLLDVSRRQWSCERARQDIIQTLGLELDAVPEGKLGIESLQQAARQHLSKVSQVSPGVDVSNLEELRRRYRDAETQLSELNKRLAGLTSSLQPQQEVLRLLRSELPSSSARIRDAEVPVCLTCEVPIDRALAEGCKLSHKLPNLAELRQKHDELNRKISKQQALVADVQSAITSLNQELPSALAGRDAVRQALNKAEKLNDERSSTWFKSRRVLDDIKRLDRDWDGWELAQRQLEQTATEIEEGRERLAAFRDRQTMVFDHLSGYFDAVIRISVGPTASGRVTLDGNGVRLVVQLGGERSTAAIESLKIIAFDLAVMCMSIEGRTHIPAFLVHDSPREADLGLSVYHQLFRMVATLEEKNSSPFQYIVTTTTQPPPEFQEPPWLRLELHGAPATERLLRCDLP